MLTVYDLKVNLLQASHIQATLSIINEKEIRVRQTMPARHVHLHLFYTQNKVAYSLLYLRKTRRRKFNIN